MQGSEHEQDIVPEQTGREEGRLGQGLYRLVAWASHRTRGDHKLKLWGPTRYLEFFKGDRWKKGEGPGTPHTGRTHRH